MDASNIRQFRGRFASALTRRQMLKRLVAGGAMAANAANLPWLDRLTQAAETGSAGDYWIELEPVVSGFNQPVDVVDPKDGTGRLFVVERTGMIRILHDGTILPDPFLDLTGKLATSVIEQGLWSIAFHPKYAENGYCYTTSSPSTHEWRLERYQVSKDPNRADPSSAQTILSFEHSGDHHYAGEMMFGPDGYLWISSGDGGGSFDTYHNAQNPATLMGAILRLDVDSKFPYAIPKDNPYATSTTYRPEIWAKGLRNPWRFSFDRLTGDMYIGNVGESTWEEVQFQPAGSKGGENYGWPELEGPGCSAIAPTCNPSLYTLPAIYYKHTQGCAVIGGYVERGDTSSPMYGTYVFSDFCNGTFWTAMRDEKGAWQWGMRMPTVLHVSTFGEDSSGHIYAADFSSGAIYKMSATASVPRPFVQRVEIDVPTSNDVAALLWIRGWNLLKGARVAVNGQTISSSTVDTTWLKATVPISELPYGSQHLDVTVANSGDSNAVTTLSLPGSSDMLEAVRAFYQVWSRTDLPVANHTVNRTWLWGPSPDTKLLTEPYQESPGGSRIVTYYDKGRMEVTHPGTGQTSDWFVTGGLLATELVTGAMQLGDNTFAQGSLAAINVAGDLDDPNAPTYATFSGLLHDRPIPAGWYIIQTVDRSGRLSADQSLARHKVVAIEVGAPTKHTVAQPFWSFMNIVGLVQQNGKPAQQRLFPSPFYLTGYPLTEAYWTTIKVGGVSQLVLVQVFERRVLTYTPGNKPGWQVEMGNAGFHYYQWRYGMPPG